MNLLSKNTLDTFMKHLAKRFILKPTELDTLRLLLEGNTVKEIGKIRSIHKSSVCNILGAIYAEMRCDGVEVYRIEDLLRYAIQFFANKGVDRNDE